MRPRVPSSPENTDNAFLPIPEILEELKLGKPVVLVDDEDRENEGDIVYAAEKVTPPGHQLHAHTRRGLICLALTGDRCDQAEPPLPRSNATPPNSAPRSPSPSTLTPSSASPPASACPTRRRRSKSPSPMTPPQELLRPGHVHPLRARDGGVLVAPGRPKAASISPASPASSPPPSSARSCNDDGAMARRPDLEIFCDQARPQDVHHRRSHQLPPESASSSLSESKPSNSPRAGACLRFTPIKASSTPSPISPSAKVASVISSPTA